MAKQNLILGAEGVVLEYDIQVLDGGIAVVARGVTGSSIEVDTVRVRGNKRPALADVIVIRIVLS